MRSHGLLQLRTLILLAIAIPGAALGAGPVHGARAAAMGTAFVAVADDPSSFAYNAAGLAILKREAHLYAGGSFASPATTYRNESGQAERTAFQAFPVPHLYLLPGAGEDEGRFGLGAFAPFGVGGRKWSDAGLTRHASTESLVGTFALNPSYARKVGSSVYVGIGADYMLAKSRATVRADQSALGATDADMALNMRGSGWGYNVGILVAPGASWSFGAAYRSPIRIRLKGDMRVANVAPPLQSLVGGSEFRTAVSSTLTFPAVVSIGLAHRPSSRTTLSFDAEQVQWSSFRNSSFDLQNEIPAAGLGDSTAPMQWRDILTLKAGWETRLSDASALRAGYAYIPSPVPGHTITPAAPDSDLHHVSVGFSHRFGGGPTVDFFYMAGFGRPRTVKSAALRGSYENSAHYAGASVCWSY